MINNKDAALVNMSEKKQTYWLYKILSEFTISS